MSQYDTPQISDQCVSCNLSLKEHSITQLRLCRLQQKTKESLRRQSEESTAQQQIEREHLTKYLRKTT